MSHAVKEITLGQCAKTCCTRPAVNRVLGARTTMTSCEDGTMGRLMSKLSKENNSEGRKSASSRSIHMAANVSHRTEAAMPCCSTASSTAETKTTSLSGSGVGMRLRTGNSADQDAKLSRARGKRYRV